MSLQISESMFKQLLDIPGMEKISERIFKTAYYSAKGFTEIKLVIYQPEPSNSIYKNYYLFLRCNAGLIMGQAKIPALDLDRYTVADIVAHLHKRIYEVNEFRCLNLHKKDISEWKADRVDIARDIRVQSKCLMIFMLNMSFPYRYYGMEPFTGGSPIQKAESCYFSNQSRTVNIYDKLSELNAGKIGLDDEEIKAFGDILRAEIQLNKKALYNLMRNQTSKRNLALFFDPDFAYGYLEQHILKIFGAEKYIGMSEALDRIQQSGFKAHEKNVMRSIILAVHFYKGLYNLEKAVIDGDKCIPAEYRDLDQLHKWMKKIRSLGFSPITIPDNIATGKYSELPSLYELLHNSRKGQGKPQQSKPDLIF